jgi:DNA modification methylase
MDVMADMIARGTKVDAIITDPPYSHTRGGFSSSALGQRAKRMNDSIRFISHDFDYQRAFDMFLKIQNIPNIFIFCSNLQVSRTMSFFENKNLTATLLVWHKTNPAPLANGNYLSDVEFVVYVHGHGATFNMDAPFASRSKVYTSGVVPPQERNHPSPKQVNHIRRYIELHTRPADTVFDPFMGGGTTGVAAYLEKRKFIGCEINDEFYEASKKRILAVTQQLTLF